MTTQYFGNNLTSLISAVLTAFYAPVHACGTAQRAINNIYSSLGVPRQGKSVYITSTRFLFIIVIILFLQPSQNGTFLQGIRR